MMSNKQKIQTYKQHLQRARALLAREEAQIYMFSHDEHQARLNRLRRRVTSLKRTIESLEATNAT